MKSRVKIKAKIKAKINNYGLWLPYSCLWFLISNWYLDPALSLNSSWQNLRQGRELYSHVRKVNNLQSLCSQQKLELITTNLLRDLPSYANRASQRARRLTRRGDTFSYVLAAGKPEFQPLPLNPISASSDATNTLEDGVEQVFFTTLERKYTAGKAVELQQFHWLLVTKTNIGWRKVMMFSQIGSFPVSKQPVTPIRESSNGVVAQAVDTWLRDCQAGSVKLVSKQ
ncbi:hypothetical protein [Calothrix sp. UHCC 0171]|uniref:hypothetical protein n=1 Tax=Calothrix sp. UHCC 0171 TaxID=3110245 RepID=UPI002B20141B|nr:hypothetical protein [Calothrix sp. UHCC 0171]MEA5571047.1 hypothetical protein [Calothrix sp. UHCC 0171]